jgi:hypothetical protein
VICGKCSQNYVETTLLRLSTESTLSQGIHYMAILKLLPMKESMPAHITFFSTTTINHISGRLQSHRSLSEFRSRNIQPRQVTMNSPSFSMVSAPWNDVHINNRTGPPHRYQNHHAYASSFPSPSPSSYISNSKYAFNKRDSSPKPSHTTTNRELCHDQ